MSEGSPVARWARCREGYRVSEPAELLRQLEDAKEALLSSLNGVGPQEFGWQRDGRSIRRAVEETVDRFNLHFSRYLARALGLPPQPCIVPAQLGSAREAAIAVQIAHRRLSNLLHDLRPEDLSRTVTVEDEGPVTLRALLDQAVEQYRRCCAEVLSLRQAYREASGAT